MTQSSMASSFPGDELKRNLRLIGGFVALVWIAEVVNWLTGHGLVRLGIYPRTLSGLIGIPLSPLIHGGIVHLLLNTVPLIVLGTLVSLRGFQDFIEISIFIALAGGISVWIFGRSAYHVGASGLIFGYFGYLVALGLYEKKASSIVVSLLTFFLYGGILWGVLPMFGFVSWEGHLFGLASGVVGARIVGRS